MKKFSVKHPTRDSTPIMLTSHQTRMICSFKQSTTWISVGKQILANSKKAMQTTDLTVSCKLLIWLKPKLKKIFQARINYSKNIQTSKRHGQRPRNSQKSTQIPNPSQIVSFQLTLTGEISRESISQANIETKVTAALATPFPSPRSLR